AAFFGENSTKYGLLPRMITDKAEIHDLTAFFAWTAWASAAQRPGHHYSYTNNWPAEQRVDNGPTAQVIVWSALSLIALLGGIGIMFAVYGRWSQKIGWHGDEASTLSFREPGEVSLTPARAPRSISAQAVRGSGGSPAAARRSSIGVSFRRTTRCRREP